MIHLLLPIFFLSPLIRGGYSLTKQNQVSPKVIAMLERNQIGHDAIRRWESGGDSAETIAALGDLERTSPSSGSVHAFNLARIFQAEGRKMEAADWFWRASHTPRGSSTRNPLLPDAMVRVVDALEDVGRSDDVIWAVHASGFTARRDLFLSRIQKMSDHPLWIKKWSLKLLEENSNDEFAKQYLNKAERGILARKLHPSDYRMTRDLPLL